MGDDMPIEDIAGTVPDANSTSDLLNQPEVMAQIVALAGTVIGLPILRKSRDMFFESDEG